MPAPENLNQNVLPWNTVIKMFVFEVLLHGKKKTDYSFMPQKEVEKVR